MLAIVDLVKEYRGGERANDGVSLGVVSGEVLGLIGPNGAGKTSLLRQIVGLSRPTSGAIRIDGIDVIQNVEYARRVCSFQPQSPLALSALTIERAISLIGRLRGGSNAVVDARGRELVEALDLEPWMERRIDQLPGGVQRLVGFCLAAVVESRVVLLDEPNDDVDPLRRRLLWGLIRRLADDGAAVVVVTHNVAEANEAVDRVAMMSRGRIVAVGPPAALKSDQGAATLEDVFMLLSGSPTTP